MDKIEIKMEQRGVTLETDVEQFALALRTWRLRQGLTQTQAGDRFGVSRYTIIKVENGQKISWQTSYKLFARLSNELRKEVENG